MSANVAAASELNRSWLLRAGLVYDTTPVQDAYRTPRLPDENRTWVVRTLGRRWLRLRANYDTETAKASLAKTLAKIRP